MELEPLTNTILILLWGVHLGMLGRVGLDLTLTTLKSLKIKDMAFLFLLIAVSLQLLLHKLAV